MYPAIAQGEYAAVKTYAPVAEKFPEVESIRNDEKRHGDTVKGLLKKNRTASFRKACSDLKRESKISNYLFHNPAFLYRIKNFIIRSQLAY